MLAQGEDTLSNRNATWVNRKGMLIAYISLILGFRIFLSFLPFLDPWFCWTITNFVHAVVTFLVFHWKKGVPFGLSNQGKYDKLTLWEQLDYGMQYTPTRKILTLVPIVLFMITTHYTDYHRLSLYINLLALAVLLIAKLPGMHQVRLLGIND